MPELCNHSPPQKLDMSRPADDSETDVQITLLINWLDMYLAHYHSYNNPQSLSAVHHLHLLMTGSKGSALLVSISESRTGLVLINHTHADL